MSSVNKKVKWVRNTAYFYDRATCMANIKSVREYSRTLDYVLETFLKRYNCEIVNTERTQRTIFSCSEEDLLIIQLAEPGAISHVIG